MKVGNPCHLMKTAIVIKDKEHTQACVHKNEMNLYFSYFFQPSLLLNNGETKTGEWPMISDIMTLIWPHFNVKRVRSPEKLQSASVTNNEMIFITYQYVHALFALCHDDVIKWKHSPRYWPFVRGIHRPRWIPLIKASDAELWCFLWSAPE